MFLLDTMVISALVKAPARQNAAIRAWLNAQAPSDLFLSVVAVAEINRGIVSQQKPQPAFAARLERWLDQTIVEFGDRILPISVKIARRWGELSAAAGNRNHDLVVAATALEHGLSVVTRNVAHFRPTGVATVDPF
ncbi:MAG: type II toxin-antitoxin system VapC family toxin [Parvularculaceae bacterium]